MANDNVLGRRKPQSISAGPIIMSDRLNNAVIAGDPTRSHGSGMLAPTRRCITRILQYRRIERLLAEIRAYQEELCARPGNDSPISILDKAKEAAEAGDIDCGWRYLQVARRLALSVTPEATTLRASAIALNTEANRKLDGWRKAAVNELLHGVAGARAEGADPAADLAANLAKVYQAAEIRDEHFNNEAYKDSLIRTRAAWLAASLLLSLLALLGIACQGYLDALITHASNGHLLPALVSLAVLGWLGATISAVTKLPTPGISSRIPELTTTGRITLLRLMMGPAFAIIAYFVTQSELAQKIFASKLIDSYTILIIALAAGFSERLVLRVFQAIDKPSAQQAS